MVIDAYDQGKLDKELLSSIMGQFQGQDVDHGGALYITTKDGKEADEVAIETWGLTLPPKPAKNADEDARDEYESLVLDLFDKVKKKFGWW